MTNDVIEHITLELKREKYKHTISAKKNDTNVRRVQAIITDNGAIVELDLVAMAVVKAIKPDGTHIYNDCTISGNTIWFVMTQQMIAAAGDVTCEIEITWEDNTVISTPTFTIHVYDTVRTGVESTNEYNGIIQAMNEAVQSKNMAAISEENAEASALSASESASAAAEAEEITEENKDFIVEYVNNFVVHNKFAYPSSLDEFPDLSIDEDEEGSYTKVNWEAWPLTNTPLAAELFNHMDDGIANLYDAVDGIKGRLNTDEGNISDLQTSVGGIEDDVDDIEDDITSINGKIGDTTSMVVPSATDLVGGLNTTYNLAAQKGEALSYLSYSAMVTALNSAATGTLKVGQSVYIGTLEVPDLWIYSEEQTSVPYTYTTDQALIDAINLTGTLQIGLYKIAFLETQKVEVPEELSDLTDVAISSPTNKQGLIFNGTSNKWENKSLVAGDVIFDNTGTDLVSNNVNDSIVEVNDKKTNNSNLAPIEATTTASRSYLVGDYLMLQGEFYKVISAIAIGDTLTVGTNIQATSVGDEISDINDRICANAISNDTRITLSYDTEYVTLVDGYLRIVCNSGGDYWVTGYINNISLLQATAVSGQTASGVNAIFVRKGSKIKYSGRSSASAIAYFYPLS